MADPSFSEIISSLTGAMNSLKSASKEMLTSLRSYATELKGWGNGPAPTPNASSTAPSLPRFTSYQDRQGFGQLLGNVLGSTMSAAGALAFALPTTQEAVDIQSIASRMKFYGGGAGYSAAGNVGAYGSRSAAYRGMLNASFMGTALSPMDAPMAVNAATQAGFLPGLKNFGAGAGYTGFMGGAALASNLTPGLGLAGGVGVMANLQNPRTINMARMFGIQMRNSENSQAVDLPQIIDQLFNILSKSATVTKENIAISAMPGNALDSILSQYFGMDPQLRGVIIAGLIQKASGADMTRKGLLKTGALTKGIQSTGYRATAEQNLIQTFAGRAVTSMTGANNMLTEIYKSLEDNKNNALVQGLQTLTVGLDTLGGARSGAGAMAIDALTSALGAAGGVLKYTGVTGKVLGGIAGVAGAYGAFQNKDKLLNYIQKPHLTGIPTSPLDAAQYGGQAGVGPTTGGQMFTGAITVNVSAPMGQDPYAFASAITQALSQAV